ncbi:tyrosine--tRNA ligase, partial [Candidatus Falkowbacteria bacterium CG10_big_fil_rev_8_21_14_0_10_37_6]
MAKVLTDKKLIEEFLNRGVENIYPNRKFVEAKLATGARLTMYLGIDPTGPTLHLGHAIILAKL